MLSKRTGVQFRELPRPRRRVERSHRGAGAPCTFLMMPPSDWHHTDFNPRLDTICPVRCVVLRSAPPLSL